MVVIFQNSVGQRTDDKSILPYFHAKQGPQRTHDGEGEYLLENNSAVGKPHRLDTSYQAEISLSQF